MASSMSPTMEKADSGRSSTSPSTIIRKLRMLGIPLKEIHEIITSQDSAAMGRCIQERLQAISQSIEELNNQYSEGKLLLDRLRMGHNLLDGGHASWSTEEIRVEDIPVSTVLFTRRLKRNYRNADVSVERWLELFQMVSQQKLRVVGPVILTYHNNPLEQFFKPDCDLEISVQVNESRDAPDCKQFGGFRAVTALHIGRNDEIIQTHVRAIQWLNQQGFTIGGPISEEYIVSPVDIINEEDHITKVIIPIQSAEAPFQ